ncbi:hypothetical protein [Actinoplanes solisilvae]|uniref:hypothetical protein n=1 Tax=Actinoplanes solisilvae TaxID=2486853 RepID=UPI000FDCB2F3|nr:hypothetical protein [Actinoplanes solisilvae]
MDRRTLLVAGGAAAVLGLTGTPARAAARLPIFEWARPGGFFFPGEGVLDPPPLAVYDDNTGFADATASLPLRPRRVESLRAHAEAVLSDPRNTRRDPDKPARDRPQDLLRVRREDGTYVTAELDAWGDCDPDHAFPAALHRLADDVQDVRRTILRGGEPWRPSAVLLAAVRLDFEPDDARPWPAGVPKPDTSRLYAERRLRGEQARTVRRKMPLTGEKVWPGYRLTPAEYTAATWRHLLPHE